MPTVRIGGSDEQVRGVTLQTHATLQRDRPSRDHASRAAAPRADCRSGCRSSVTAVARRAARRGPERRTSRGRGLDRVSRSSTPAFRFLDLMITSFFHDWEHRLASVSKDRVVRPFEWGEDWVTSNGHHSHDAQTRVPNWVTEAMSDTQHLLRCAGDPGLPVRRRAGVVTARGREQARCASRAPSSRLTRVNNTVHARWFPAGPHSDPPYDAGPRREADPACTISVAGFREAGPAGRCS